MTVLPLTVIGGYLGAGKTTLVNHLLRHAGGLRLAVLVNEFGALPIDEDLIEAEDDDIISIAGGCVCCSYGNDLTLALMRLGELDPAPDHVLLEASGVAIPSAIAASVSLLQTYAMDGILVLANAETIEEQASDRFVGDTVARQLTDADLIILNKTDLVDGAERARIADWLRTGFGRAEVVEARHGALPREILLQSYLTERAPVSGPLHEAATFETATLDVPNAVDPGALGRSLAGEALALVRAKGFVRDAAGELVSVQTVGRRWDVAPAPPGKVVSPAVVVIGLRGRLDLARVTAAIAGCAIGRDEP